ncbi:MAG: DUF4062 domain-containing protein, partial [Gemmatimonadota bacterium]
MPEAWKTVRVFISSTFRDMQAERDHLVRVVFPRLREEILKRRIHFVDVDLRWGVTADQDAFDLCMHEIEQCHPRFLCMLGGRDGWVPPPKSIDGAFVDRLLRGETKAGNLAPSDLALFSEEAPDGSGSLGCLYSPDPSGIVYVLREKPKDSAEMAVWDDRCNRAVQLLREAGHPETMRSITASEVHHGALDRLDKPTYQYFYFRDPSATEAIREPDASVYREEPGSFGASALSDLKARIERAEGLVQVAPGETERVRLPVFVYPSKWDPATRRFANLQEFGDRVYEDLLASVDWEFGPGPRETLGRLAEEKAALEAFVEDRLERYVMGGRRPVLEALLEHARSSEEGGYLCVVGDPGSGKSALMGRLLRDCMEMEIGGPSSQGLVVSHFIGVNSTDLREMLWRLCSELVAGVGLPDEVP